MIYKAPIWVYELYLNEDKILAISEAVFIMDLYCMDDYRDVKCQLVGEYLEGLDG